MRYYEMVSEKDDPVEVIEGGNHVIEVRDGFVQARVYKRKDVSLEMGAQFAGRMADRMSQLLTDYSPVEMAYAIVDLSDAPAISGPITRGEMGRMIATWEQAARPIIIVVGDEPIKDVQYHGIVSKQAPRFGRVVASLEEARAAALELLD